MKRFRFPLDRVLDWRRGQARLEESALERLHAEARAIETQRAEIEQAGIHSALDLATRGASGAELAALESFRRFAGAEAARLDRAREDCERRIKERIAAVTARRRDVKLIENLKGRQFEAWRIETARAADLEVEELAALKPRARAVDPY